MRAGARKQKIRVLCSCMASLASSNGVKRIIDETFHSISPICGHAGIYLKDRAHTLSREYGPKCRSKPCPSRAPNIVAVPPGISQLTDAPSVPFLSGAYHPRSDFRIEQMTFCRVHTFARKIIANDYRPCPGRRPPHGRHISHIPRTNGRCTREELHA